MARRIDCDEGALVRYALEGIGSAPTAIIGLRGCKSGHVG